MKASRHSRSGGFTLVELLVAVVIGLITTLIMMQALTVAEGYRRTTTTGGDAQANGSLTMFTLQRDIRLAGYGFSTREANGALANCATGTTTIHFGLRTPATYTLSGGTPFVPVAIVQSSSLATGIADTNTDVIQVIFSNNIGTSGSGIPVMKHNGGGGLEDWYEIDTLTPRGGLRHGDLALVAGASGCGIIEVTNLPYSNNCGDVDFVTNSNPPKAPWLPASSLDPNLHTLAASITNRIATAGTNAANYRNFAHGDCATSVTTTTVPAWNTYSGGTGATTDPNAPGTTFNLMLYPLGSRPDLDRAHGLVIRYYAVRNQKLVSCDHLFSDCFDTTALATNWTVVADDIVSLRAYYGMGAQSGSSYVFSNWQDASSFPTSGSGASATTAWGNVISLKVAIVARSNQYEKDCVSDQGVVTGCPSGNIAHNNGPAWSKDWISSGSTAIDVSGVVDWQHYRYRTLETTIPLRNAIWK